MPKKFKKDERSQNFTRVNERIRFSPLLVIDENGDKLGVISNDEAQKAARKAGLDLVEVAPQARPPVCRIMDFGKFKYEQGLKEKKQRQNSKSQQTKEVRLSPKIAEHDVVTKTNAAKKFLEAGHKVQLRLEYKRRENAHKELGFEVMKKVIEGLEGIGKPMRSPKLEGRFLMCLVEPDE
jgi:translation initiation factor IF-3